MATSNLSLDIRLIEKNLLQSHTGFFIFEIIIAIALFSFIFTTIINYQQYLLCAHDSIIHTYKALEKGIMISEKILYEQNFSPPAQFDGFKLEVEPLKFPLKLEFSTNNLPELDNSLIQFFKIIIHWNSPIKSTKHHITTYASSIINS